jgi:hypothetical protein
MDDLCVRDLTFQEYGEWDQLVHESPQGSVFLQSDFLQMLCNSDKSLKFVILGCFNTKGRLKAGQAYLYRQLVGINIGFDTSYFYNGPVIAESHCEARSSKAEFECNCMTSLANEMSRRFPNISVDTHPSISDLRPFIRLNWKINLHYTHIWDLKDPESLWHKIREGERKKINHAQKDFAFQKETWNEAGQQFLNVFQISMKKHEWQPDNKWNHIFSDRVRWMEDRNLCTLITARDDRKELKAGALVVLSKEHKTAYFWRLGYVLQMANSGIVPGLCYAASNLLVNEVDRIDWAEGMTYGQSSFKDRMGTNLEPYYKLIPPNNREEYINIARRIRRKVKSVLP